MAAHARSRRAFLASGGSAGVTALLAGRTGAQAVACPAAVAPPAPDAVDRFVEAEMKARGLVGFAIAVVQHGRLVKAAGYGLASLEHRVPVTTHTRFHLDSLSKLFTAVAVMQLVEQGRMKLDDPIGRWLDGVQPAWAGITIRHLLTHSSGIVDDYAENFQGSMLVAYDENALWEHARSRPLEFRPGEKARYNNLGFFLLTLIVQRAGGSPFPRHIEDRVLRPAGMTESGWPSLDDIVPNLAEPYVAGTGGVKHFRGYMASQAGFSYSGTSTVLDLARFASALDRGAILKPSSLAEMDRPFRLADGTNAPFGLPWELASYRGHATIAKGGSSGAMLMRFPERDLIVIALGNVAMRWPVTSYVSLAHDIAGHFDPALARRAEPDRTIDPTLKARLHAAFWQWLRGEPGDGGFSPAWLESWPAADRQDIVATLVGGESFELMGCDRVQAAGATSYGAPIAETCSVRIATPALPVPLTFGFHRDAKGRVAVIDND